MVTRSAVRWHRVGGACEATAIRSMGWPQRGQTLYYKEPLNTKTANSRVQQPPSPQSASRQSPSGLLWEHECSVVASSAVASHCPLRQWSNYSAVRDTIAKGNKRLVQLSRSDDRGHCLAIVTRSVGYGRYATVTDSMG